MRATAAALAALLLLPAAASAGVEKGGTPEAPAAESGGVEVRVPNGRVRLQCWQNGQKIVDEGRLSVTSLGLGAQANAITFGRPGDGQTAASIVSQNWTTCMLRRQE